MKIESYNSVIWKAIYDSLFPKQSIFGDVSDLVDSVDLADKRKIVDLAASFDDSQKIVSKQLANEYLMEILNLPENDIKEMIHMALYETEMNYYSQIKSFLI